MMGSTPPSWMKVKKKIKGTVESHWQTRKRNTNSWWEVRTCREREKERKRKEKKRNEGTVWCWMEELDHFKSTQYRHVTSGKTFYNWANLKWAAFYFLEETISFWTHSGQIKHKQHSLKRTASPSTFSLEPRWLPTTDSSTATQRCLSGKLGAMKYRDWPGQQEVWGCDSSFRMYGMSEHTHTKTRTGWLSDKHAARVTIFSSMFLKVRLVHTRLSRVD